MMKRIAFVALMALFTMNLWAQQTPGGGPRFDPKEFQQRMEAALAHQAGFTAEESKAFFPLYKEMKEKQRGIGVQIHQLKKDCKEDEASCAATLTKIKQLQVESSQLEQSYYKRLLEVVPASKLIKVMKAEDDFHRRMVQGSGQRRGQNGHRPRGQRSGGSQQ